jgi:hypothetical protein
MRKIRITIDHQQLLLARADAGHCGVVARGTV